MGLSELFEILLNTLSVSRLLVVIERLIWLLGCTLEAKIPLGRGGSVQGLKQGNIWTFHCDKKQVAGVKRKPFV